MSHRLKSITLSILLILFGINSGIAQTLTQTIRGKVVDQISQSTLPGASVILLNSSPLNGTATDINGNFKLINVPVGMQTLKISFMGYKELTVPNINVTSGKEVILSVALEENIVMGKEIVITAEVEKDKPFNGEWKALRSLIPTTSAWKEHPVVEFQSSVHNSLLIPIFLPALLLLNMAMHCREYLI